MSLGLYPSELNKYTQEEFNFKDGTCMPKLVEPWMYVVMTIAQEASSEPFEGMVGVAEVIRERAESKYNSDGSLIDTVLRPLQFSGWNTNDPNRLRVAQYELNHPAITRAITAYKTAFEEKSNYALGANLYHADWMNPYPDWTKSPKVTKLVHIGHTIFYREER